MSFLELEGFHAFITGAAGGIGSAAVEEFLTSRNRLNDDQGNSCKVTAHDKKPLTPPPTPNLHTIQGDIADESSVESAFSNAKAHFGPINILIANAGITDESHDYPIWETPLSHWESTYRVNVRGTFLTIKHFLRSANLHQQETHTELPNLAIVVTGSETGKFGQSGHAEYASGKAGLQYGLIRGVKNEIVRLNSKARINAVAPGWVDTPLIGDRLDDPKELWAEAQAKTALKKVAKAEDVARAMAFLASHRAAGHISGECLSVDGGMEGRLIWKENEVVDTSKAAKDVTAPTPPISQPLTPKRVGHRVRVALSVDFDAISAHLGTGKHPDNNMADYSAGIFAGKVGAPRLVRLFKKLGVADKMTWFIPGHSMETFPVEVKQVVEAGCEIGLHGYSHEGAYQMTGQQEEDVLQKCIDLATKLTGKKPIGYRAPLYQIRETTIPLLEKYGFEYDSSLTHHDSQPYQLPLTPPIHPPDFSSPAATWMHPLPLSTSPLSSLTEIPCNWYGEDETPLSYLPHVNNSHGYVDTRVIEQMWKDRFMWLWENSHAENDANVDDGEGKEEKGVNNFIFPMVLHPDTSGMAHVIGMVERMVVWLKGWGEEVEFWRYEDIAREARMRRKE
ncbi:MAG: hypothetical protein Q9222_002315 [Ikaeria aurantiellina]